jgi:hypothetical protein
MRIAAIINEQVTPELYAALAELTPGVRATRLTLLAMLGLMFSQSRGLPAAPGTPAAPSDDVAPRPRNAEPARVRHPAGERAPTPPASAAAPEDPIQALLRALTPQQRQALAERLAQTPAPVEGDPDRRPRPAGPATSVAAAGETSFTVARPARRHAIVG